MKLFNYIRIIRSISIFLLLFIFNFIWHRIILKLNKIKRKYIKILLKICIRTLVTLGKKQFEVIEKEKYRVQLNL